MIVEQCQRWELGREFRRPAGEPIKIAAYDVVELDSDVIAKAFVREHHYARTCSSASYRFGLYQRGELAGVAVFGCAPSMNAHRKIWPTLELDEAMTLSRLVLLECVPGNGESWFVARCFEMLRAHGVVGIESCADPIERFTVEGRRVFPGHGGTIYQATNGRYIGRTNPATLRLLPDGTVFSNRASGKLVRAQRGIRYATRQLVDWGADPLNDNADRDERLAWLDRWRSTLTRPLRHHGNHRYLWCLDRRRRREVMTAPALPYPKIDLERAERAA